ncbi:unnamed protein product [Ectocarpus sp. 12 AP-2014]
MCLVIWCSSRALEFFTFVRVWYLVGVKDSMRQPKLVSMYMPSEEERHRWETTGFGDDIHQKQQRCGTCFTFPQPMFPLLLCWMLLLFEGVISPCLHLSIG